jgi:hypothetical protein
MASRFHKKNIIKLDLNIINYLILSPQEPYEMTTLGRNRRAGNPSPQQNTELNQRPNVPVDTRNPDRIYVNAAAAPANNRFVQQQPAPRNNSVNSNSNLNSSRITEEEQPLDDSMSRQLKQQQLNDPNLLRMKMLREQQQRQLAAQLRQQPPAQQNPNNQLGPRYVMDSDV